MPNFNRTPTAFKVVGDVLRILGLPVTTTIAGSTDKTVVQMWQLATEVGQQLMDEHDWQFLYADMTVVTTPGNNVYPLPDDFGGFGDDASWNRTNRLPAIGSLTEVEWAMLKARNLGGTTFAMMYIISNNAVEFYDVGSTPQTIVLPYASRGWVVAADNVTHRDELQADDDKILFDPQLFKVALKLAWQTAKGFDVTGSSAEMDRVLGNAKDKDAPARTLSLRKGANGVLLNQINIPDTNYGS
jgi:hypothetical protein